jgi:replicative superfamily II helicase
MQEKVGDWNKRFSAVLGVTCQELTSDTDAITNAAALSSADIICTTPEKFGQHAWHIPSTLLSSDLHGNLPQSSIW